MCQGSKSHKGQGVKGKLPFLRPTGWLCPTLKAFISKSIGGNLGFCSLATLQLASLCDCLVRDKLASISSFKISFRVCRIILM